MPDAAIRRAAFVWLTQQIELHGQVLSLAAYVIPVANSWPYQGTTGTR